MNVKERYYRDLAKLIAEATRRGLILERVERSLINAGLPLTPRHRAFAERAGVSQLDSIRLVVTGDFLPQIDGLPSEAYRQFNRFYQASAGFALGYAVVVRSRYLRDETLRHEFAHVAQCERAGGVVPFIRAYTANPMKFEAEAH